ncbi:MAG: ABC transporter ATP-binding protein [Lachnospiraceae bacterium]|nr:ABC transporter ATP-binding protein [Lachnospiraceae bacterium]
MAKGGTLINVLRYIGRYWYYLIVSLICAVVYSLLSLYVPILTGDAIDMIIGKGNVNFDGLASLLVKMAVVVAVAAIAWWIMGLCNNKITYSVIRDVRKDAFKKIQKLHISFIDSHSHGDMVSRVIADVDTFADGLLMGFSQLFTGIITIVATLVFMVSINFKIALIVVVLTPLSLIAASVVAKATFNMSKKQSEIRGKQTAFIDEMVGNLKVVKAHSHEDENMEVFDEVNDELKKCSTKAIFYSSITNPLTRFINGLVYAVVALSGGLEVISGVISVGCLSTLLIYANQYTKPFNEISGVVTELQTALACAARIFELINYREIVPDDDDAYVLDEVQGSVELKNVSFSYVPERKLIENFNVKVEPGQRVAIVGPTGCGKTTIINLLMRFYDVNDGEILIDGHNVQNITRESLRTNFGMVLQETWLKSGTIRDNIAMAKENATLDEVIAAAKAAHAHSFIKRLEKGYDTVIGEDGGSLSQGQKQLLCIARLMLALPPMLILDEATSSIDTRTELKIQNAFAKLMKGRTSFIVAHRLSTIKEADIILVMKDGNVIEQGNHEELMARNGFYTNLYNSQFES